MTWLTRIACLLACSASLVHASDRPDQLLHQLGDPDFDKRVAAERELLDHGISGIDVISTGLSSPNPEVRARSRRLLQLLHRVAFDEQRDRIRENPWILPDELAPAWEQYQAFVGDGLPARDLYVRMIEQEPELMLAVAQRPASWPAEFERRCTDLRTFVDGRYSRELDPASVATLLFLAVHPDNQLTPLSAQMVTMLIDRELENHMQQSADGPVFRALLSYWVVQDGHTSAHTRLNLARRFDLAVGVQVAREILANRNAPGQSRTQLHNAIQFMSAYGGIDVVPDLEPLLSISAVPRSPPRPRPFFQRSHPEPKPAPANSRDLQLHDLALLALLQVTGQSPEQYGFNSVPQDPGRHYNSLSAPGFSSDAERQAAVKRWYSWRQRHPLRHISIPYDASQGEPL